MPKEDKIEVQGRVVRALPGGRFLVEVAGKHLLTAHIAGKIRKFFIQVMPGDVVKVEVSVYDKTKGRIVYRYYDENEAKRDAQGKRGEDE